MEHQYKVYYKDGTVNDVYLNEHQLERFSYLPNVDMVKEKHLVLDDHEYSYDNKEGKWVKNHNAKIYDNMLKAER